MESKQIKLNQKIGFLGIFKTSILVSSKNINFIIFAFIISLPLFCFLVYYEFPLQKFLLETFEIVKGFGFPFYMLENQKMDYLQEWAQMGFLCLIPFHLLQLITVLPIVDLASKIYKEGKPMSLKDMVQKPMINMERLRGTLIPFLYVAFLSTCALLQFTLLVTISPISSIDYIYSVFPTAVLGGALIELLILYSALSAVGNTSIVVSVLEGVYGIRALSLSSYYTRGNDLCGIILMLVFFAWENGLRFSCRYIGCYKSGYGIIAQVSLSCLGNTLKWIVFVVHYHNCKDRTLVKKVDEEAGSEIGPVG
ncbi:uncharacterized protein LOC107428614 [Ziziphus jujuba]|uniref:Uncharacterized protein LOC107428614 n=1 Tax=Ziziphus jujuba TaxID=326968 RepID=A0ABM3ZZ39_ZIZJJ|nr:uncharacterized protein LOC107428614 [Ziziphus jujuba]